MFQGCVKGVLWMVYRFLRMFQGVARLFHEGFKGVLKGFQGCFKDISRILFSFTSCAFQCFKIGLGLFKRC